MHAAIAARTGAEVTMLSVSPVRAAQCDGEGYQLKESAIFGKLLGFEEICGHPIYAHTDWFDVVFATGAREKMPIRILSASADVTVRTTWHAVDFYCPDPHRLRELRLRPLQISAAVARAA